MFTESTEALPRGSGMGVGAEENLGVRAGWVAAHWPCHLGLLCNLQALPPLPCGNEVHEELLFAKVVVRSRRCFRNT